MVDKSPDQENTPELERTSKEVYLDEKQQKEAEERLRRQEQQEDQSLREGMGFLVKSSFQFVFYVVIGAFVVIFSRDLQATNYPGGVLLMFVGLGLIIKGMISLGGFNSK